MRPLLLSVLLCCLWPSPAVHAQNGGIDRRFGVNGIASLRDPDPAIANARFLGLAACAAPGGGLNVVTASAADRLTLFRLDTRGRLDRSFSGDGIATARVPEAGEDTAQGACMADGRIVIARMAPGQGSDTDIHLIRLQPDGALDASFGQGSGLVTLDMDQYAAGLGDLEYPLGLNLDSDGSVLVSQRIYLANASSRPGLARLRADGTVQFARIYAELPGTRPVYATAAGLGANGRLWLVGGGNPHSTPFNSWFRTEVDPLTGDPLLTLVGSDGNYVVDGGRVLPGGIMVVAGKYVPQTEPGGPYRPRLLVFREQGTSHVVLPQPAAVNVFAPSLSPFPGRGVAIPIADGRVLVGIPLGAQNQEWELATYAAVVELGATPAQDRVDARFGVNGATQFAYRTAQPCANGSPPPQRPVRFSNWRGRPVVAGIHAVGCASNPRNAFAATLLLPTDVFGDDFE